MAKSIGSDIHFVFAKFAASIVVVLIHIVTQLLCRVIRRTFNKSLIGPLKMKYNHKKTISQFLGPGQMTANIISLVLSALGKMWSSSGQVKSLSFWLIATYIERFCQQKFYNIKCVLLFSSIP